MKPSWQTYQSPVEPSQVPWKAFVGECCPHGLNIALVDGTYVRNHFDSDFSQGGNGFRYRFVPRREIWLDADINPTERPFIAFHECQEVERMRMGYGYSRAHDQAKHLEDAFRHHDLRGITMAKKSPATSKKKPKLRGKARDLASKFIAEEMHTKKYPRAQAIAIGISRAIAQGKKSALGKRIKAIIAKHL
jgi:hypothetical protein